jgi:DNA-3-methyladenine glycosylase II
VLPVGRPNLSVHLLTRATLATGIQRLRGCDPALAAWMDRVGPVTLRRHRHRFGALCRAICSQQISKPAAATVYGRFVAHFAPAREPDPESLLQLPIATLRKCGLSGVKAKYLHALADEFLHGELGRLKFSRLDDQQIVDAVVRVPGLGVWSAEMFLIFSVGRADVFSVRDLALRNGVQRHARCPRGSRAR